MNRLLAILAACVAAGCVACTAQPVPPADPAQPPDAQAVPAVLLGAARAAPWPSNPDGTAWLTQAGYRLLARSPGQFVSIRAPLAGVPDPVQVVGRFQKVGGPPGGGYGLIVDDQTRSRGDGVDQGGEYVVAEVGDRGQIGVWRREASHWVDLLPWVPSSAVLPGDAPNELEVRTAGTWLTFVVNGRQVANLDTGLSGGAIGVFAGGDGNDVLLEQFVVQPASPPVPASAPSSAAGVPRPAASAPAAAGPDVPRLQRVQQLLAGIADDIMSILESFSGGPDSPHSPVSDPSALHDDANRLGAATDKARDLADELDRLRQGARP